MFFIPKFPRNKRQDELCRATQGSTSLIRRRGERGDHGQGPSLWFPWEAEGKPGSAGSPSAGLDPAGDSGCGAVPSCVVRNS